MHDGIKYIKQIALGDCRLYFLPLVGAIKGIKAELARPRGADLKAIALHALRLFVAPLTGAIKSVRDELQKQKPAIAKSGK